MSNSLCFDTTYVALVAIEGLSKVMTTTHHDLPLYSVRMAVIITVDKSKGCTSAPHKSFRNYLEITSTRIEILGMVDYCLDEGCRQRRSI